MARLENILKDGLLEELVLEATGSDHHKTASEHEKKAVHHYRQYAKHNAAIQAIEAKYPVKKLDPAKNHGITYSRPMPQHEIDTAMHHNHLAMTHDRLHRAHKEMAQAYRDLTKPKEKRA